VNHSPQVSVVMPVYNGRRWLGEAVESILAQTLSDFEFVIVDDGSMDGSPRILEEYAQRDARVRVISRANTGIVGALNDGLAAARGELTARMDADDRCQPERFERQLQALESDPEVVAVGTCAVSVDPDGNELGDAPVPLRHEDIEAQHLRGISCIYHPAVMMRTKAVRSVGGYRQQAWPAEDFDLWLRLGEVGRLANLPEKLFTWRRRLDGIVSSTQDRMDAAVRWALEDCWRRRALPGRPSLSPSEPMSRPDLLRQWGWQALRYGHLRTSRRYARRALFFEPWNPSSWRLAYCALRG
jgi:glycosyltransferase involved in cell wall biosynthesis